MKKLTALLALGTLLAGSHALAGTVEFSSWPKLHSADGGGPFKFTVKDTEDLDGVPGSFFTFCLEMKEKIKPNSVYQAVINTGAQSGPKLYGKYGANDQGFDALSSETAWLYNQYVIGEIVFDKTKDATGFQNAIWYFEDEDYTRKNDADIYIDMVTHAKANDNETWDWGGIGNVRVLNLTTEDGKPAQDVLTTVPIPGAVWLFGSALLGFAGLARRST
ncbi:VPLPA-CTERM sorting domain-containing protein [Thiorhodovibrio frisius]|uniref:PEP-CTERM exosortase interaction domain-containing protein n=1 Tax=Thiorhodovibrio frisius TaxID=631362 RepID=H8Z4W7_9GAMM|nr:VPLPA-CTERM sorting domain-containing protein [Thiorhodovibrio frisius]EIC20374.1 hypothetical protein Thi970DRAFT_04004 [Thiorhodovibrio frisius]WPL21114.1 hypothetical protein Thiofri_01222 [Thiorhodovibrio frisius]